MDKPKAADLNEFEARLSRVILEQAEQAIVVCNARGVIIQASQAAHRLYDGNLLLQPFEKAFHLRLQAQGSAADLSSEEGFSLARVLQGETYQRFEAILKRQDGQKLHVLLNAGPFEDKNGVVLGCVVSLTEITAQEQPQEALRAAHEQITALVEQSPLAIVVLDRGAKVIQWNPAAERLFGWRAKEVLGHPYPLVPDEEWQEFFKYLQRELAGQRHTSLEQRRQRKDGKIVDISLSSSPLHNAAGEVVGVMGILEDITTRKQAEEMLRRQAELLDLAHDAILVRDLAGRITYWNRGAEELYGWPRKEAMGNVAHQLLATESPEPLDIITRVIEHGHWEGEVVHTTRDGRRLIVASRWSLKRDKESRPLAILEINHDVTTRRQAEEALKRSERRFQRLVEANIVGIVVANEETIVEANEAFLQMLGYTREEMQVGEINWVELTPNEYLPQDAQALYELRRTGAHAPFEKAYNRKDGSQVSVVVGGALLEEDPLTWVSFILDISERKQLEAALRQSEARFRAIFSNASIGIATTDLKGRLQQFNAPVIKGLGYVPTELQGKSFLDLTHPEDLDKDAALFAELAAGKRNRYQLEKRYVRKDGQTIWGRLHGSLARNFKGEPEFAVFLMEDITARKEVQASLEESEARYRSLVDMSPDAILVHVRGRIRFVNPAGCNLFGAASPQEILGQHIMDLVHPDSRKIIKPRVTRTHAGERVDLREIKILRLDGQVVEVESAAAPVTYHSQSGVQVMVRDITERKRAEEALRWSENRFRAFMDNSPTIAWAKDEAGRHVYLSKTYENRFGVRLDDWLGKTDFELWPQEIAKEFRKNDLKVLAGDQVIEVIEETINPDGGRCYWWNFKFPFEDAAGNRYVGGIGVDITERKRAEEALQESEDRFRKIFENAGIGIAITDWEGRFQRCNPAYCTLLGYTEEELRQIKFASLIHPEDRKTNLAKIRLLQAGELKSFEIDNRYLHKDGQPVWVHKFVSLLPDATGNPKHLLALITPSRDGGSK